MNNPIAICIDRNPFGSIEQLIPLVAKVGFTAAEWFEMGIEERWTDPATAAIIRKLSRENELICQYHAPYEASFDLGHEDGAPRTAKSVAKVVAHMLDRADRLGTRLVTSHLGTCPSGEDRSQALQTVMEGILLIAPELERRRIRLALENHTPSCIASSLGDRVEDFEMLMANIRSGWVGQTVDVAHAHLNHNLEDFLARPFGRVFNMHLHDNHGETDEHLPLGKGTIPWDEVLSRISESAYHGPLTLEFLTDAESYLNAIGRIRCCN